MIDEGTVRNTLLAAKRIMESESRHNFEVHAIDDGEHIPRMERVADAVRQVFTELDLPSQRCDAIHAGLIEHARQLYIAEWMRPQPGDESPPLKEDAIRAFDKHLSKKESEQCTTRDSK